MNVFNDIGQEIQGFFEDLNWTFVFVFVSVIYGIKNKEEFIWYNKIFDKNENIAPFKIWIAGLVVMIFFCFFRYTDGIAPFNSMYVSTLMRSFIITIVFQEVVRKKIKQIDK